MYSVHLVPSAQKDLDRLGKRFFDQIKAKLVFFGTDPRPPHCRKLTAEEGYRVRSGDYRILYRIDDENKIVYVYRIKHRRESYR